MNGVLYSSIKDLYNFGLVKGIIILYTSTQLISEEKFMEKLSNYLKEGTVDNVLKQINIIEKAG